MSVTVTVNPPSQILLTAVNTNEYSVSLTSPSAISVSVSPQSGLQGLTGNTGPGVPIGGTARQRLAKVDSVDFNTQWVDPAAGVNKEVQFNDAGAVGGDPDFIFDKDEKCLAIGRPTILDDNPVAMSGNVDSYLQANIQNKNAGVAASSDYVATADDGTDSAYYIDMGINSSGYSASAFSGIHAHNGYLIVKDSDLALGADGNLNLLAGGFLEENIIGSVKPTGIDLNTNMKFSENGFNLTDLIVEVNGATAETAAFAAGSKIVIRSDLIV